jgi:hypothetical protein
MKRLILIVVSVLACVASYQAMAHGIETNPKLKEDAGKLTADLAHLLNYKPTDGASDAGRIRRDMDPV